MSLAEQMFVDDLKFDTSQDADSGVGVAKWDTAKVVTFALNEVLQSAALICAVSSVTNALADAVDGVSQDAILAHLPQPPRFMSDFSGTLIGVNLETRLFLALRDFEVRLQAARSMAIMFCRYPADVPLKGGVHIDVLSGTWRDVCEDGISLLRTLRAMPATSDRSTGSRLSRTLGLLIDCANGGSPCVLQDGSIEVPGLVERRRNARTTVDWSAVLLLGPDDEDVQITNISPGGLNFIASEKLSVAECITLQFSGGRCLRGTVVWTNANTYGIKFTNPLAADDPLLLQARG